MASTGAKRLVSRVWVWGQGAPAQRLVKQILTGWAQPVKGQDWLVEQAEGEAAIVRAVLDWRDHGGGKGGGDKETDLLFGGQQWVPPPPPGGGGPGRGVPPGGSGRA